MIRRSIFLLFVFISLKSFSQNPLWDSVKPGFGFDIPLNISIDTFQNKAVIYGGFKYFGTTAYNGIFTYDGINIDSLGNGVDGTGTWPGNSIFTICGYKGKLYVGGAFQMAGAKQIPFLAVWDGTNWDSLPVGCPNGAVGKMIVYNNELYITGDYNHIGSLPTQGFVKWDGSSLTTYTALPYSMYQTYATAIYNGELYFGGNILSPPNLGLVKFDGTNWSIPASGVPGNGVADLQVYGSKLYVAGYFSQAGNPGDNLITWDGNAYGRVFNYIDDFVNTLEVYNGKLLAGGCFAYINNTHTGCLVAIDSVNFCRLGTPISNCVTTIKSYNGTFLMGGGFTLIDTTNFNCLAQWAGGNYTDTCDFTVGISEYSIAETEINLYPNPANEILNISFELQNETKIQIKDLTGKLISEARIENTTGKTIQQINISSISKGIYFVNLCNDGKLYSKKFIKE